MRSQIYIAILCTAFLVSLTKGTVNLWKNRNLTKKKINLFDIISVMKFSGYSWQEPSKRGNIFNMISQLGENSDNEEILDRLFGTPKASVQLNPLF